MNVEIVPSEESKSQKDGNKIADNVKPQPVIVGSERAAEQKSNQDNKGKQDNGQNGDNNRTENKSETGSKKPDESADSEPSNEVDDADESWWRARQKKTDPQKEKSAGLRQITASIEKLLAVDGGKEPAPIPGLLTFAVILFCIIAIIFSIGAFLVFTIAIIQHKGPFLTVMYLAISLLGLVTAAFSIYGTLNCNSTSLLFALILDFIWTAIFVSTFVTYKLSGNSLSATAFGCQTRLKHLHAASLFDK